MIHLRIILFLGFAFFQFIPAWAQPEMPNYTKYALKQVSNYSLKNKIAELPPEIDSLFPAKYNIDGRKFYGMMAFRAENYRKKELQENGILVTTEIGDVLSLKVPLEALSVLDKLQSLRYVELPYTFEPNLDRLVKDTKTTPVHQGIDLPKEFTGKDVIVGVIDWGFDFTHPVFYDSVINRYRVIACWDHWKNSGPAPEGFNYGTLIEGQDNLLKTGSDTANNRGFDTHGTHVAGIAGGGGAGINAIGVAPECEFLFLQIHWNVGSFADAVEWMYQKARKQNKRLVINMSFGNYHRSTLDSFSFYHHVIREYTKKGVIMVSSAGNNGARNCHIKADFNQSPDTMRTHVTLRPVISNYAGQRVITWGQPNKSFSCMIELLGPNNARLYQSGVFNTVDLRRQVAEAFTNDDVQLTYIIDAESSHPLNRKPNMNIVFRLTDESYKIVLKSWADDGIVHFWNIIERSSGTSNTGMPFERIFNNFVAGDNFYTVSDPAVVKDVITVGAHQAENTSANGTILPGPLANFSSLGPTPEELVKPDISAPGVLVLSAISSFTDQNFTSAEQVNFQGKTYDFARFNGTSMSGPAVAGIAALVLEANSELTHHQVKEVIKNTAYEDIHTGDLPPQGNFYYGKGKANAHEAVKRAIKTKGSYVPFFEAGVVFPNPVSQMVYYGKDDKTYEAELIDLTGKVIAKGNIGYSTGIDVSWLGSGMYFLRIYDTEITVFKVIVSPNR